MYSSYIALNRLARNVIVLFVYKALDCFLDGGNKSEKIIKTDNLGAQQFKGKDCKGKATQFADAIKHEFKSPNYTTRWSDIIELR